MNNAPLHNRDIKSTYCIIRAYDFQQQQQNHSLVNLRFVNDFNLFLFRLRHFKLFSSHKIQADRNRFDV